MRPSVAARRDYGAGTEYADGMVEHDGHVGKLLKALDDLGIADNTIVLYTTDNGPHMNTWPDGAMTPFRSEKNTNWEGAFRVPVHDPLAGPDQARLGLQRDRQRARLVPDIPRRGRRTDIKEKLLKGHEAAGKTFKVHLDGYNQLAYLTGQARRSPRARSSSTSATTATWWPCVSRTGRSCSASSARQAHCAVWAEPFTPLRLPKMFDLRADPYERADVTSNTYYD